MKQIVTFCITIGLIVTSLALTAQKNCKFKGDYDGIKVYTCDPENTPFNTVKVKLTLDAELNDYLNLITNLPGYIDWQYNATNIELVKRYSKEHFIYVMEIDSPWPAADRDIVLEFDLKHNKENNTYRIDTRSRPQSHPLNDDFERVPYLKSWTKVNLLNEGKLDLEFFMEMDPGGYVPVWLINMVSTKGPVDTFQNVRDLVQRK